MTGLLGKVTQCRGCGKDIAFIKTVKGKSMPVDPESVYFIPGGGPNTYVMIDGEIQRGREPRYDEDKAVTAIGYRSHFATCSAAEDFRKKTKSERTRD